MPTPLNAPTPALPHLRDGERLVPLLTQTEASLVAYENTSPEAAFEGDNVKVLPLEIGGLMSLLPAAEAAAKLKELTGTAHRMGVREDLDPFVTLSFLSLTVIPELKLTPRGYFDVRSQSFVPFAAG